MATASPLTVIRRMADAIFLDSSCSSWSIPVWLVNRVLEARVVAVGGRDEEATYRLAWQHTATSSVLSVCSRASSRHASPARRLGRDAIHQFFPLGRARVVRDIVAFHP
jgi:hypothetical protein